VQADKLHRPVNYLRGNLEKSPHSHRDQLMFHQQQCHIMKAESVSERSDFYSVQMLL